MLLWLPSVEALDQVAADLAAGAHPGLVVVEMGTLPLPAKLRARATLGAVGAELMDAPVSGTGHQAADATLVIFASGSAAGFEKARPVFDLIGESSYHFPQFGHGSVMKYLANLLVTVHNLAAAEASPSMETHRGRVWGSWTRPQCAATSCRPSADRLRNRRSRR